MFRPVVLTIALLACGLCLFAPSAFAQEPAPTAPARRGGGTVRLAAGEGGQGPIELKSTAEGFAGELSVINDGKEPLVVSRMVVRGDAPDPRVPPKVSIRVVDGVVPMTVPPGATKKVVVSWAPERGVRLRQLFGHVVVTTSDEQTGDVALGIRAQLPGLLGPFEGHLLSLVFGVPLLGAVIVLVLRALGRRDEKTSHRVALGALAVQAALVLYVYRSFATDVSHLDGNDGLQFIEHGVWLRSLGLEIFFGVDGTSAATLLATSLVALFAIWPERVVPKGSASYHAAYLVLAAAAPAALCAMDGVLFVLCAAIAVMASALVVSGWGGPERRLAALKLALLGAFAVACLLITVLAISKAADPTYLVDGTKVTSTFSFPELARVAIGAKSAKLFGGALVKVAFVLVLVASLVLLAAFPLHAWLAPTLMEATTAAGALVSAALPAIGGVALLRIGCAVLPEGMRWASGVVVALGAITSIYGALISLGQTDLRKLAAAATTTQVGFILLGAGSLTPQGLSGAMVLCATRALGCGLFLVLAGAIEDRSHTRALDRLEGIASQMPGWATAFALASLAQAGVMGLGGAWGPLLALLGSLPNYPPLALLAALALVLVAAAHFFALSRIVFGKLAKDWQRSPLLEPFGGRFPDLDAREWASVAPLVVLVIVMGVWPSSMFATTTGTVRDLTNAVSPPGPEQIASAE